MTVATKELHEDARRRWADALRDAVCNRFEQGESAGVIAQSLGITRSAVSGLLHRNRRHRAGAHSTVVVPSGAGELAGRRPPKQPAVELAPFTGDPVELMQLTGRACHWPMPNDGAELLFCGAPVERLGRSSYCRKHQRVAYPPAKQARP